MIKITVFMVSTTLSYGAFPYEPKALRTFGWFTYFRAEGVVRD
ncbi:MAG: hypothetical protein AAB544_02085 [Patescibacteria group bacterium]